MRYGWTPFTPALDKALNRVFCECMTQFPPPPSSINPENLIASLHSTKVRLNGGPTVPSSIPCHPKLNNCRKSGLLLNLDALIFHEATKCLRSGGFMIGELVNHQHLPRILMTDSLTDTSLGSSWDISNKTNFSRDFLISARCD